MSSEVGGPLVLVYLPISCYWNDATNLLLIVLCRLIWVMTHLSLCSLPLQLGSWSHVSDPQNYTNLLHVGGAMAHSTLLKWIARYYPQRARNSLKRSAPPIPRIRWRADPPIRRVQVMCTYYDLRTIPTEGRCFVSLWADSPTCGKSGDVGKSDLIILCALSSEYFEFHAVKWAHHTTM